MQLMCTPRGKRVYAGMQWRGTFSLHLPPMDGLPFLHNDHYSTLDVEDVIFLWGLWILEAIVSPFRIILLSRLDVDIV